MIILKALAYILNCVFSLTLLKEMSALQNSLGNNIQVIKYQFHPESYLAAGNNPISVITSPHI